MSDVVNDYREKMLSIAEQLVGVLRNPDFEGCVVRELVDELRHTMADGDDDE